MVNGVGVFLMVVGLVFVISGFWLWLGNQDTTDNEARLNLKGLGIVMVYTGIIIILLGMAFSHILTHHDIGVSGGVPYHKSSSRVFGILSLVLALFVVIIGAYFIYGPNKDDSTEQDVKRYAAMVTIGLSIGSILFIIGIALVLDSYGMIGWSRKGTSPITNHQNYFVSNNSTALLYHTQST